MTELEKIIYTKSFIDRLAQGINPLDDTPIPDGELLNNIRISRCLYYTSEILRTVIEEKTAPVPPPPPKEKHSPRGRKPSFYLTDKNREMFPYSDQPIPISDLSARLNLPLKDNGCKKLSITAIKTWLKHMGYIYTDVSPSGTKASVPTEDGLAIGITSQKITHSNGTYVQLLYARSAQELIVQNTGNIVSFYAIYRAELRAEKEKKGAPHEKI